jgi:glutamate synthase (NADPH/NADH) small chain
MSAATGPKVEARFTWQSVPRRDPPKRSAAERMADFLEIYGLYDEATAREQASRCIQCPEPVCVAGCPLGSRIPEWLALTAEGQFLEAAAILHSTSNLPEVCASACPADRLCEGLCLLDGRSEPVSIKAIEQFLNDYAFAHGGLEATVAPANGWRVAVIGANPGGLACADELARRGCAVTVFDADLLPEALHAHGVPAFKLEQSVAQRRIDLLRRRGVEFQLGFTLDAGTSLAELQSRFDAVYLGLGARQARTLDVPGADLSGVVQALPFIIQISPGMTLATPPVDVGNKRVVVVGGGDTALDCIRTTVRLGARESVCVYRRAEADMPCSRRDYDDAVEEGARFIFQAAPLAVLGDSDGVVTGLRLVRTRAGEPDASGRHAFQVMPGKEFEIRADWIFLALGFDREPLPRSGSFARLKTDEAGAVVVDDNLMTSLPGVFAGGDIVRGPVTALQAVRDARKAALGIHEYLSARAPAAKA